MELLQGRHAALVEVTTGGLVAPPSSPVNSGTRRLRGPVFASDAHVDEVQDELGETPATRGREGHPRHARASRGRRATPSLRGHTSGGLHSSVHPARAPGPRSHGRRRRGALVGRAAHGSFITTGNSTPVGPFGALSDAMGPLAP